MVFFSAIVFLIGQLIDGIYWVISLPPSWLFIILIAIATYLLNRGKWGLVAFVTIGLVFIDSLNFWNGMLDTLSIVLSAGVISVILGVPLGIWMAKKRWC